ncbi:hypothetical protein ANANG_G00053710 [Anguilla anguilla]|uniref:Uncharacterized protein n=1 Tax=Anguilla anguilla TaxID=7936 RepID=A0A9D3MRZ5_ANGAN|nr:hypothetical protein ANANG_G00053710 [Anguilla anguilla]
MAHSWSARLQLSRTFRQDPLSPEHLGCRAHSLRAPVNRCVSRLVGLHCRPAPARFEGSRERNKWNIGFWTLVNGKRATPLQLGELWESLLLEFSFKRAPKTSQ